MTPLKDVEEKILKEAFRQADNILERANEHAHSDNRADIVDLVRFSLSTYRTRLLEEIARMKKPVHDPYLSHEEEDFVYNRALQDISNLLTK